MRNARKKKRRYWIINTAHYKQKAREIAWASQGKKSETMVQRTVSRGIAEGIRSVRYVCRDIIHHTRDKNPEMVVCV